MHQITICRIVYPALDRYGIVFMEQIAQWAIVQNHDLAQIRLNRTQVFDIRSLSICAVLSIVSCREKLPFGLKPVDYRVGILLNRSSKNNQVEPLAYSAEKLVTIRSLVYPVQDWMLRNAVLPTHSQSRSVELDFNHVAAVHSSPLGHAVDERLVKI